MQGLQRQCSSCRQAQVPQTRAVVGGPKPFSQQQRLARSIRRPAIEEKRETSETTSSPVSLSEGARVAGMQQILAWSSRTSSGLQLQRDALRRNRSSCCIPAAAAAVVRRESSGRRCRARARHCAAAASLLLPLYLRNATSAPLAPSINTPLRPTPHPPHLQSDLLSTEEARRLGELKRLQREAPPQKSDSNIVQVRLFVIDRSPISRRIGPRPPGQSAAAPRVTHRVTPPSPLPPPRARSRRRS
jgi:hypothetical protein